jgi:sodium-dependent dicarboxylate transporter 2/3/5
MRRIKLIILATALILCMFIVWLPPFEGLTRPGQNAMAVFVLCVTLWVTALIPISITGLLAIVLLPAFGVVSSREAFSYFGNSSVFFILGLFIMAAALLKTGLSSRIALLMLTRFDRKPAHLIAGIFFSSAFLALWMPAHTVAALLVPTVLEIARALRLEPMRSNYGRALFFSMAWGAIIGGVGTLMGGARNPLAIGILGETFQLNVSFLDWAVAAMPIVVVVLAVTFPYLLVVFPPDVEDIRAAREVLSRKAERLGPMSSGEKRASWIIGLTILCWVFSGHRWGLANISIFSAITLMVLNVMTWRDVEDYVNWGIILMYGGAIALGSALNETGALIWVMKTALGSFSLSPFLLVCVVSVFSKMITEGMSNVATVAVFLPVAFGFVDETGINPLIMMYAVAVPAGLAFCLPVGTPPNAIAYSSGYYSIMDSLRAGVLLNILTMVAFILMAKFYWPLIGLGF